MLSTPQGLYVIGYTKFETFSWHSKNLKKLSLIIINAIIQWAKLELSDGFFPVILKCHWQPSFVHTCCFQNQSTKMF